MKIQLLTESRYPNDDDFRPPTVLATLPEERCPGGVLSIQRLLVHEQLRVVFTLFVDSLLFLHDLETGTMLHSEKLDVPQCSAYWVFRPQGFGVQFSHFSGAHSNTLYACSLDEELLAKRLKAPNSENRIRNPGDEISRRSGLLERVDR